MGEEDITCIIWKSESGGHHLGDLRKYGMVVIKRVVLKKYGINVE